MPQKVEFKIARVDIDKKPFRQMLISDYPTQVGNGWAYKLFNQDGSRVVMNLMPLDREKGEKAIDRAVMEKELKLEKVIIKIKKGPKEAKKVYNMPKLSEIKIIRKLFMKEIKPQDNEIKKKNIEKVILKPEKITINKVDNQVKTNNIKKDINKDSVENKNKKVANTTKTKKAELTTKTKSKTTSGKKKTTNATKKVPTKNNTNNNNRNTNQKTKTSVAKNKPKKTTPKKSTTKKRATSNKTTKTIKKSW